MILDAFRYPVALADITDGATNIDVDVPEAFLPDLARAFEILAIESIVGTFTLVEAEDGCVDLTGEVVAKVTQSCVVTLEPVAKIVREPVEIRFVAGLTADSDEVSAEMAGDQDATVDILPLEGDSIDLAPIMIETVALGLDPYPRAPGAAFEGLATEGLATDRDTRQESPFAALEQLKSGSEN